MRRTCLVTKSVIDPKNLLRFTVVDGKLIFDADKKAPGRGGYVTKSVEAIERLPKIIGKVAYFLKVKKVDLSEAELERGKSQL